MILRIRLKLLAAFTGLSACGDCCGLFKKDESGSAAPRVERQEDFDRVGGVSGEAATALFNVLKKDLDIRDKISANPGKLLKFEGQASNFKDDMHSLLNGGGQFLFRNCNFDNITPQLGEIFVLRHQSDQKVNIISIIKKGGDFLYWVKINLDYAKTDLDSHKSIFADMLIDADGRIGYTLADEALDLLRANNMPDKVEYIQLGEGEYQDQEKINDIWAGFNQRESNSKMTIDLSNKTLFADYFPPYENLKLMLIWTDGHFRNLCVELKRQNGELVITPLSIQVLTAPTPPACEIISEDGLSLNDLATLLGSEKTSHADGSWQLDAPRISRHPTGLIFSDMNNLLSIGVNSAGEPFCNFVGSMRVKGQNNDIVFTVTETPDGRRVISWKKMTKLTYSALKDIISDRGLAIYYDEHALASNCEGADDLKSRFNKIISESGGKICKFKNFPSKKYFVFFVKVGEEFKPIFAEHGGIDGVIDDASFFYIAKNGKSTDLDEALAYSDELLGMLDEENKIFMKAIQQSIRDIDDISGSIMSDWGRGKIRVYKIFRRQVISLVTNIAKYCDSKKRDELCFEVDYDDIQELGFSPPGAYFIIDNNTQDLELHLPALAKVNEDGELKYFDLSKNDECSTSSESHDGLLNVFQLNLSNTVREMARIGIGFENANLGNAEVSMVKLSSYFESGTLNWDEPEYEFRGNALFSKKSTFVDPSAVTKYIRYKTNNPSGVERAGILQIMKSDEGKLFLHPCDDVRLTLEENMQLMLEAGQ